MVEVKAAKNRVQPANLLQAKCFFSRAMMGGELVAVPIFRGLHDLCHELLATFRRKKEKLRGGWVQSANFASECARKLLIL